MSSTSSENFDPRGYPLIVPISPVENLYLDYDRKTTIDHYSRFYELESKQFASLLWELDLEIV